MMMVLVGIPQYRLLTIATQLVGNGLCKEVTLPVLSKEHKLLAQVLHCNGWIVIPSRKILVPHLHFHKSLAVVGLNGIVVNRQKNVKLLVSVMIGNLETLKAMVSAFRNPKDPINAMVWVLLAMDGVLKDFPKINVLRQRYGKQEPKLDKNVKLLDKSVNLKTASVRS